jgi:hypothetical protein
MNTAASQGQLFALGSSRKYRTAPNDKNQQFSPRWIADFARTVFGGSIALDPASSPIANEAIAAAKIYTIADDALSQSWEVGTLFFNPPYGAGLIGPMIAKFLEELPGIDQAIVLVNSSTCAGWYQSLLQQCDRFLLPKRRISFWTAEGCPAGEDDRAEYQTNPPGGNRFDQTLFYFGPNVRAFEEYGGPIGMVCAPISFSVPPTFPVPKNSPKPFNSDTLTPVFGTTNFPGTEEQPQAPTVEDFAAFLQGVARMGEAIADAVRSSGIAPDGATIGEESKAGRDYWFMVYRHQSRRRPKKTALKGEALVVAREQIDRRNFYHWLNHRIAEVYEIIAKLKKR